MRAQTIFQRRGRDRLAIIFKILEITLDGSLKTQIMYRANLSFAQLNDYISLLLSCKLVEKTRTKEKIFFKTTPKGILFLKSIQDVRRLLTTESFEETFGKSSVVAVIRADPKEERLAKVILSLRKHADKIIVFDAHARDRAIEIAESMGVKVLRQKGTGKGVQLRSVITNGMELEADVLIILNGDGRHDPDKVPALIRPILESHADVVVASPVEGEQTEIPLYRRLGNKAIAKLADIAARSEGCNAQCGFQAYGRKAIEGLKISKIMTDSGADILISAEKLGLEVVEVPIVLRKTSMVG